MLEGESFILDSIIRSYKEMAPKICGFEDNFEI